MLYAIHNTKIPTWEYQQLRMIPGAQTIAHHTNRGRAFVNDSTVRCTVGRPRMMSTIHQLLLMDHNATAETFVFLRCVIRKKARGPIKPYQIRRAKNVAKNSRLQIDTVHLRHHHAAHLCATVMLCICRALLCHTPVGWMQKYIPPSNHPVHYKAANTVGCIWTRQSCATKQTTCGKKLHD